MDNDVKLTLPEAMQIVFECLKELDKRIAALEESALRQDVGFGQTD